MKFTVTGSGCANVKDASGSVDTSLRPACSSTQPLTRACSAVSSSIGWTSAYAMVILPVYCGWSALLADRQMREGQADRDRRGLIDLERDHVSGNAFDRMADCEGRRVRVAGAHRNPNLGVRGQDTVLEETRGAESER